MSRRDKHLSNAWRRATAAMPPALCHRRLPPAPARSRTLPPALAAGSRQESHGGKPPVVQVVVVTVSGDKLVVDVEMLETVGDLKVSGLFK